MTGSGPNEVFLRAFPAGLVTHVLPGNVPSSTVISLIRALLTKNVSVLKPASGDPVTAISLALSLAEVDKNHPVAKAVSVASWPAGDEDGERVIAGSDAVCVWGRAEAIARAHLVMRPKRSVALIGREVDFPSVATGLAHDISLYDQAACFSTQEVFAEGDVDALVGHLATALEEYEDLLPLRRLDADSGAYLSTRRLDQIFEGGVERYRGRRASIIVAPFGAPTWELPLDRTIVIRPVTDLMAAVEALDGSVQTVAAAPWSVLERYRDAIGARGVSRLVEVGLSNLFRIGGTHDGLRPLQRARAIHLARGAGQRDPQGNGPPAGPDEDPKEPRVPGRGPVTAADLADGPAPAAEWRTVSQSDRSFVTSFREGLLSDGNAELIFGGRLPGRRFVILDGSLAPKFAEGLRQWFARREVEARFLVLPGGGGAGSLDSIVRIADEFLAFRLDRRNEPVIVVGGMSVTNVGSFAASIYRRGVPFLCVPTTPLAFFVAIGLEPDLYRAGVGGDTGRAGQPARVVLDPALFASAPLRCARAGGAELLRASVGRDAALFSDLERAAADLEVSRFASKDAFGLLWRAVSGQVAGPEDTLAGYLATWLGQAILRASRRRLPVGTAVGAGVAAAAQLAAARGCLAAEDNGRVLAVIDRMGLLADAEPGAVPELAGAVSADFARSGPGAKVLVPTSTGHSVSADDVTPEEVSRAVVAAGRWPLRVPP